MGIPVTGFCASQLPSFPASQLPSFPASQLPSFPAVTWGLSSGVARLGASVYTYKMASQAPTDERAAPLAADWRAIKIASIKGVSDADLAKVFGVTRDTIRQRRCRDSEWKAACPSNPVGRPKPDLPQNHVTAALLKPVSETVGDIVTASLDQIGQQNQLLAARFAHDSMQRAIRNEQIPDPSTWQELAIANKMVRTNTGLDKEQPTVNVNLWGGAFDAFQVERDATPSQEGHS